MRINGYTLALLCAFFSVTGCIEENFDNTVKRESGDDVVFGARAGFENNDPDTKTIYMGTYYEIEDKNEKGESITRRFEEVHWLSSDKVLIHCDQGNQTAHYSVSFTDPNSENSGNNIPESAESVYLTRMQLSGSGHNAIQWQDMSQPHTFYAIYPSPYQFDRPDVDASLLTQYKERIIVSGSELQCYLPKPQAPKSIKKDGNKYVAEPNMDYAYMVAKQIVTPEDNGGGVSLDFCPIVTALEVEMSFPSGTVVPDDGNPNTDDIFNGWSDIYLSSAEISSIDGTPIVGTFSMNMEDYTFNKAVRYPEVSLQAGTDQSSVIVQLLDNGQPIKLSSGGSIKFTVFLMPRDIKLNNLQVTVNVNGVYRTAKLSDSKTIQAHKKQYITGITLPANPIINNKPVEAQGSNWVSQLDPATYLSGLSIPGTANSFSYNYTGGGINNDATRIDNNYMTQTLSFDSQWNLGVRCFELVSDRCGTNSSAGEDNGTGNLGSQNLRCNNESLGLTVKDAFDRIVDKVLATPGEFAMVIMTYQPRGGQRAARNPEHYMSVLKRFYDNYTRNGYKLSDLASVYKPRLRVADLDKKPIMIVVRPSQEGEDSSEAVDAAQAPGYNLLTVKGWGTLMDKWRKRGYDLMLFKGRNEDNRGSYGDKYDLMLDKSYPAMEDWIYGYSGQSNSAYPEASRPTPDDANFSGPRFNYTSDQGFGVWAQEWRRVASKDATYSFRLAYNSSVNVKADWTASIEEKKNNIEDCLKRSILQENGLVYFNSLDGFYIIDDQYSAGYYWRGNMGDIGGFADYINDWFYPVLQKYSAADVTGPLGVIIMDRVSNVQGSAGQLLPQTIIQNNFMFNVPKDPNYTPAQ